MPGQRLFFAVGMMLAAVTAPAAADDAATATQDAPVATEDWAIHGQSTLTEQYHPAFRSPYQGTNSLSPKSLGNESFDMTLYVGVRPWAGAEIWADGEVDQGFGLSDTLGVDGFPNGEALKVGSAVPYVKLPRLFFRQTIDLSGDSQGLTPGINQLGGNETTNRIVITAGKFAVPDVFDTSAYANDARHDLLNWALVDGATFDYAANAWGYTYGAAIEWYQDRFTLRAGLFDLSDVPNSTRLEATFARQFQAVTELEERHQLFGQSGAIRILAFLNHGRMGTFKDAIALAEDTHEPADTALVRHFHERSGVEINLEQKLTDDLGLFARAGYDDPSKEPYEFTDTDAALSGGFRLNGDRWGRKDDILSLAFVLDAIGREHAEYFNLGGLGILAGDGRLPHPGDEKIIELQYDLAAFKWLNVSPDYQYVDNPAFNRDRGPVSVLGIRVHAEY